jgi:hypothetical protein
MPPKSWLASTSYGDCPAFQPPRIIFAPIRVGRVLFYGPAGSIKQDPAYAAWCLDRRGPKNRTRPTLQGAQYIR